MYNHVQCLVDSDVVPPSLACASHSTALLYDDNRGSLHIPHNSAGFLLTSYESSRYGSSALPTASVNLKGKERVHKETSSSKIMGDRSTQKSDGLHKPSGENRCLSITAYKQEPGDLRTTSHSSDPAAGTQSEL